MANKPVLVTPAVRDPVSIAELKDQLRITSNDEADYLRRLIRTATTRLEEIAWRQFITATYDFKLSTWPTEIRIPRPPLQSVTSITYLDTAGASQTLAASVYEVVTWREPGVIRLKNNQTWPSVQGHDDVITVRYVCGYGSAATDVPEATRQAILMLAAHLYEERGLVAVGNIVNTLPIGIEYLLDRCHEA